MLFEVFLGVYGDTFRTRNRTLSWGFGKIKGGKSYEISSIY